jgi:hypothetical protein
MHPNGPGDFRLGLCVGDREARADRQRGELIDRIAAGAPIRKPRGLTRPQIRAVSAAIRCAACALRASVWFSFLRPAGPARASNTAKSPGSASRRNRVRLSTAHTERRLSPRIENAPMPERCETDALIVVASTLD